MKIFHNENLLDITVLKAETFMERAGGLLFRRKLTATETLLLKPCNSIHTVGMRYPIDVVYINANGFVLKIIKNMRPFKFSYCKNADTVLELLSNTVENLNFNINDRIIFTIDLPA
jgi:uncharacterized protein